MDYVLKCGTIQRSHEVIARRSSLVARRPIIHTCIRGFSTIPSVSITHKYAQHLGHECSEAIHGGMDSIQGTPFTLQITRIGKHDGRSVERTNDSEPNGKCVRALRFVAHKVTSHNLCDRTRFRSYGPEEGLKTGGITAEAGKCERT